MFVGRAGDLVIRDRRMSKVHVKLGRSQRGMWTAQDAGSKNGLCVNGRVIAATHVLSDGDVLRAGDSVFLFERQFAPMSAPSGSVGRSAASAALFEWIERRGSSDLHLLITGESGVGKDVAARALHDFSGRRGKFVPVNAGAIPPALREAHLFGHARGAFTGAVDERAGFVAAADGGTLFLDEVAELDGGSQVALLRVLENREVTRLGDVRARKVDLRVVAATNADLPERIAAGRFRPDLHARFDDHFSIQPLRRRRGDVPVLIEHFAHKPLQNVLDTDAIEALMIYRWPLNTRELRSVMRRALSDVTSGLIGLALLPDLVATPITRRALATGSPTGRNAPAAEELLRVFARYDHVVSAVAEHFKKDRRQIYRWLERYGLDVPRAAASKAKESTGNDGVVARLDSRPSLDVQDEQHD
jgi:DNA-binding NtrC family response regulator